MEFQEFDTDNVKTIIATKDRDEIGTVSVYADKCIIRSIEVYGPYRNKGVGSKLLKEVEKLLLKNGCTKCYVSVRSNGYPIVNFFEKNGYKYFYTIFRPGSFNVLRMKKDLKN